MQCVKLNLLVYRDMEEGGDWIREAENTPLSHRSASGWTAGLEGRQKTGRTTGQQMRGHTNAYWFFPTYLKPFLWHSCFLLR